MKETNERAVISLLHEPTSEYVDWMISEEATPSVYLIENAVNELRDPLLPLLNRIDSEGEKLSKEEYAKIDEIHGKIYRLRIDELEIILTPKDGLPEGVESERDYLEECIQGLEVINTIVDFFWKHSGNTTALPEDSRPRIKITDRNGEAWESPISKALRKGKNSAD